VCVLVGAGLGAAFAESPGGLVQDSSRDRISVQLPTRDQVSPQVAVLVSLSPADAGPGSLVTFSASATIQPGWHIAALGDAASLRALYDKAPRESLFSALEMALHGGVSADVVAWVAAWHGPDVEPIFRAVARRLTTPEAREQLRRLSWALPQTTQELA